MGMEGALIMAKVKKRNSLLETTEKEILAE